MPVFGSKSFDDHEQVVFCRDVDSGLKAIIAIHDTTLGPALGGARMWPYASEDEAVEDALRLARGMTYKAALAGIALGGGKSVIIGDPARDKSEALWLAFGRFVDSLGGRYIVAEDVGTSVEDIEIVRRATPHSAGLASASGDPSGATAFGVYQGILAAVACKLGREGVSGLTCAVQGLGHVGMRLCDYLARDGAELVVSDINADRVAEAVSRYGATAVAPERIHAVAADVFVPCALGAVINDRTIPELGAAVVAGSANNQLAEDRHGAALAERGILYAPDYVINAGGVINVSYERTGYDRDRAFNHAARIRRTLESLFAKAAAEGTPTNVMADRIARERIRAAKRGPASAAAPATRVA